MNFSFEAENNGKGDFILKYKNNPIGFIMRQSMLPNYYEIFIKGKLVGESPILPSALNLLEEKLKNNELTDLLIWSIFNR